MTLQGLAHPDHQVVMMKLLYNMNLHLLKLKNSNLIATPETKIIWKLAYLPFIHKPYIKVPDIVVWDYKEDINLQSPCFVLEISKNSNSFKKDINKMINFMSMSQCNSIKEAFVYDYKNNKFAIINNLNAKEGLISDKKNFNIDSVSHFFEIDLVDWLEFPSLSDKSATSKTLVSLH